MVSRLITGIILSNILAIPFLFFGPPFYYIYPLLLTFFLTGIIAGVIARGNIKTGIIAGLFSAIWVLILVIIYMPLSTINLIAGIFGGVLGTYLAKWYDANVVLSKRPKSKTNNAQYIIYWVIIFVVLSAATISSLEIIGILAWVLFTIFFLAVFRPRKTMIPKTHSTVMLAIFAAILFPLILGYALPPYGTGFGIPFANIYSLHVGHGTGGFTLLNVSSSGAKVFVNSTCDVCAVPFSKTLNLSIGESFGGTCESELPTALLFTSQSMQLAVFDTKVPITQYICS